MKGDKKVRKKRINVNKGKKYPKRLEPQPWNIESRSKRLKTGLNFTDEKHGGSDLIVPELKQNATHAEEDIDQEYTDAELKALEAIRLANKAATEVELESSKKERREGMVEAEKAISAHYDSRTTKERAKFTKVADKTEGASTGRFTHLNSDPSKQYLEKEAILNYGNLSAYNGDHRDFVMEYIYGPMVRIALYGRSPQIELVAQEGGMADNSLGTPKSKRARATRADKIYLTSKLLGDGKFMTLSQYSGSPVGAQFVTSPIPELVGMEAALLICAFIGDGDIHGANFGINTDTKEVYKIDLGKAGFVFYSSLKNYLEDLVEQMKDPRCQYIDSKGKLKLPFNVTAAKDAVNNILNVLTEEFITNTLEGRTHNLEKAGFAFSIPSLASYVMDVKSYTVPSTGLQDIKTFTDSHIKHLVDNRKMFEKFANYLSIAEKIDTTSLPTLRDRKYVLEQLSSYGELALDPDKRKRWEELKEKVILDEHEIVEYNSLLEYVTANGLSQERRDEYISLLQNILKEKQKEEMWRNGDWLLQMKGMDPIEWALENSKTIDGKTPLQFLRDLKGAIESGKASGDLKYINDAISGIIISFTERNILINGKNALQYAIENGIMYEANKDMADFYFTQNHTISGKNPLSWAMERNLTIHGKDILSFVKARREEVAASGVGFTTAIDQCISEAMKPAPVAEVDKFTTQLMANSASLKLKIIFCSTIALNNKKNSITVQDYGEQFARIVHEYITLLTKGPEITKEIYDHMLELVRRDPKAEYHENAINTLNTIVGMHKFHSNADRICVMKQIAALEKIISPEVAR